LFTRAPRTVQCRMSSCSRCLDVSLLGWSASTSRHVAAPSAVCSQGRKSEEDVCRYIGERWRSHAAKRPAPEGLLRNGRHTAARGVAQTGSDMGRRGPRLAPYRRKRHFEHTPEPAATPRGRRTHAAGRQFVIHLHHARQRHFDLRLQVGGVLRSWAVPKGPSRDPSIKRLAVEVEDHPLSYGSFEGTIPEGHYGAGTVAIWDEGTWSTEGSAAQRIDNGHLRFELHGSRLRGRWSLVRTRMQGGKPQWLL